MPRYGGLRFWETFDLFASWLEQQKVDCFLITKGEKGIYLLLHKTAQTTFYQKLYQAISEFSKATVHIVVYEASIASLETLSNAFAVVDCAYVYAYYDLEDHIFFVSEKQKFHTGGYPGFQEDLQQIRQAIVLFFPGHGAAGDSNDLPKAANQRYACGKCTQTHVYGYPGDFLGNCPAVAMDQSNPYISMETITIIKMSSGSTAWR